MKRLLLLLFCTLAAQAQGPSWLLEVEVVRVPASHVALAHVQLLDEASWRHHVQAHDVEVLESEGARGTLKQAAYLLTGGKIPVPYADPRTGGYQVQYVDSGLKLDVKATELTEGRVRLDCAMDRVALTPGASSLPEQEGLRLDTNIVMKPGQVAIVGATHGRFSAQYAKRSYPNQTFSENDSLVVAISLRRF